MQSTVGGTLQRTCMNQQPFAQESPGDCETNVKSCLGNTPKNLLGGESPEDKCVILPQDIYVHLLWQKTFNNAVEKTAKKS